MTTHVELEEFLAEEVLDGEDFGDAQQTADGIQTGTAAAPTVLTEAKLAKVGDMVIITDGVMTGVASHSELAPVEAALCWQGTTR